MKRLIPFAALVVSFILVTNPSAYTADTKATAKDKTVDAKTKKVKAALDWIAKNQRLDGSWNTGMGDNRPALVVTTSMCALALMASGKPYQLQVAKAANYVADNIMQDRAAVRLGEQWDQSNWKIAIGGLFLCEHYAALKKKNPKYKNPPLHQLIDKVVQDSFKRMEASGGWGHTPRIKNALGYIELEVMSNWMLAMHGAAQKLGMKVPDDKLAKAFQFIEDCCNEKKGEVGYSPNEGQKGFGCPCRTGGAIFAFALLDKEEHRLYPLMVDYWKKTMGDSNEGHGSIAIGFISSALAARQLGDEDWKAFEDKHFNQLLENANANGSFKGLTGKSFQAKGNDDDKIGDAYNTGIFALMLQLDLGNLRFLGAKKKKAE